MQTSRIPNRNLGGEIALLPSRRAGRKRAVAGKALTGTRSPRPAMISPSTFCDERGRRSEGDRWRLCAVAAGVSPAPSLRTNSPAFVHRREVHRDNFLALFAVGLSNRILDGGDGLVRRQHAGDGEEADLHDRVDAPAHAAFARDLAGVDDVETRLLLDEPVAAPRREDVPRLSRARTGVFSRNVPPLARSCSNVEAFEEELADGSRRNSPRR